VVTGHPGWRDRRLLDRLGAAHPIIAAPMAGAAGVELAIGAIEGGGIGSLPCALLDPETVREQVAAVRARAQGPLNLNFFCHNLPPAPDESAWRALLAPCYDAWGVAPPETPPPLRRPFDEAMAEAVQELRPDIVSFHFGLPDETLLDRVKRSGAFVIGNATSVAEARRLAERGADAIIAQGYEAGGHTGRFLPGGGDLLGLFALLPQVADAVEQPVIAAGGIADARGIAAALRLGASAVQIGTAYLACPESLIAPPHRAALGSDKAGETVMTNLFTGGRARGMRNALIDDLGPLRAEAPPYPYAASALAPLRAAAEKQGRGDFTPMWAGQAAPLARALPARALTEHLARETLALIEGNA